MTGLKIKRRSSLFITSIVKKTLGTERAERQSRCIGNWLSRNTIDESYRRRRRRRRLEPIEVEPNLADLGNFPSHITERVSGNPRFARGNLFPLRLIASNSD